MFVGPKALWHWIGKEGKLLLIQRFSLVLCPRPTESEPALYENLQGVGVHNPEG